MNREIIDAATKNFVDQGKLIEAGWVGYKLGVLPPDAPDIQISECRLAFFAGCQHLFGSIMSMLDPGEEPTESDLNRMTLIERELTEYIKQYRLDNSAAFRS